MTENKDAQQLGSTQELQTNAMSSAANKNLPWYVWPSLAFLLLMALAVIFVLPSVVENYELPLTPRAEQQEVALPNVAEKEQITLSPFEEAQKARRRSESQDVLAQLLSLQSELDAIQASEWAEQEYSAAVSMARLGDESYRAQNFAAATEHYTQALEALQAIEESIASVLEESLAKGQQALQENNSEQAVENFQLALLLAPDNALAALGLQRAETLDQIIMALNEAKTLIDSNRLDEALVTLETARSIDENHAELAQLISDVKRQVSARDFTQFMSKGFAELRAGRSDAAITQFERALALQPNSAEASAAIAQTQDQLETTRIQTIRGMAEDYQQQEQWSLAVAKYEEALAIDPNLIFAAEGKDYAQKRQQLDSLLRQALQDPLRLGDAAVFDQAVQVYYTGRQIVNPGPVLSQQLDDLEQYLSRAQIPVDIQLVSDGVTTVTLYQVGELGQFNQHVVSLTPGDYVVVGSREGYRDVRREFTVGFDSSGSSVTVICDEAI
ncbi:MAG: hypothetical protein R3332_06690 [Pseudohongiellaceae bacterium]|nr:hypothetical protein [Pseudohongiellaceae bacterium]